MRIAATERSCFPLFQRAPEVIGCPGWCNSWAYLKLRLFLSGAGFRRGRAFGGNGVFAAQFQFGVLGRFTGGWESLRLLAGIILGMPGSRCHGRGLTGQRRTGGTRAGGNSLERIAL